MWQEKLVGLSCLCWQESLFVLSANEFSYSGAYYVKFTSVYSLCSIEIGGGLVGYKIGIRNKSKQKQKAGRGSKQVQTLNIDVNGSKQSGVDCVSNISQSQKAGKDSVQEQNGGIENG